MPELTFVTPVARHHTHLVQTAIDSVKAQTIPCEHVIIYDVEGKGAGHARNKGLAKVQTDFVAFLDADDEVLPEFAKKTIAAWQPKRFVYVDWYDEDKLTRAPDCPWMHNTRNIITSLLRTADAQSVGGFDESLQGMEDTEYFLKLLSKGICGLHVHEPLFRYRPNGARSKAFYNTPQYHVAIQRFNAEFGGRPMAECGSCGGSPYAMPEIENLPIGEAQPGDVLAEALWAGNRQTRGRVTGRLYPRASKGKRLWVSERDIDGAPYEWARVVEMPGVPTESDFQRFAKDAMRQMTGMQAPSQPEIIPVQASTPIDAPVKADVANVLRMYQKQQSS